MHKKINLISYIVTTIFLTLNNPISSQVFAQNFTQNSSQNKIDSTKNLAEKINQSSASKALNILNTLSILKTLKDNIAQNENFSLGVYSSYNNTDFSFDTPAGHSILKWQEMKGYSFGTELKYKFFDNQVRGEPIKNGDIFFSYTYSNQKGEGTDDDISNYDSSSSISAFSVQKAKGNSHDIRLGTDIDFEKYKNFTPSIRIGGFYKKLRFEMSDGNIILINYKKSTGGNSIIKGLGQRTDSTFSGITIGGKISHKTEETENVLIFDFYPAVKYQGKQFWPQREPKDMHWELENADPGFGFKIALEHYFKINNQDFKIFSAYESIRINRLNQTGSYYSVNGGSDNSASKGSVLFDSFAMGIGIYF